MNNSKSRDNALGELDGAATSGVSNLEDSISSAEVTASTGTQTVLDALDARWNVLVKGGKAPRPLDEQLAEAMYVENFGAVGDNVTDDTASLQRALDSGEDVYLSSGKIYLISDTLSMKTPNQRFGGNGTINFKIANNEPSRPAVYLAKGADKAILCVRAVNHNGQNHGPINDRGGHLIWASAIFMEADECEARNVTVLNGADNGIAVCRIENDTIIAGAPRMVRVTGCRGSNCGCATGLKELIDGVPTPRGRLGAAVDIGSGNNCIVSDCLDEGSYIGFILDLGAGAQAVFSNCIAYATKRDYDWAGTTESGTGFYIGGADSHIVNCQAFFCENDGFWFDAIASYTSGTNLMSYGCKRHGYRIDNDFATFTSCVAKANSQDPEAFGVGYLIGGPRNKAFVTFLGCMAFQNHKVGFYIPSGVTNATPTLIGGRYEGLIANVLNDGANSKIGSLMSKNGNMGAGTTEPEASGFHVAGKKMAGNLGDTGNAGQFAISPENSNSKRLSFEYDDTANMARIQAIEAGIAHRILQINPYGGHVTVGKGTFDNTLVLNNHYLWVDASSRLRISYGPPASDNAGAVVGSQA